MSYADGASAAAGNRAIRVQGPSGAKGTTVKGTLYVDVFDTRFDISGEVVALPYEYKIGAPAK